MGCSLATPRLNAASGTWNFNPDNSDWNNPLNWQPAGVPNGPADIAAFGLSNIRNLFLSANTEVDSIVFNAGASAYTITANPTYTLTVSGAGIANNSGHAQNLVAGGATSSGLAGSVRFDHNASAGNATIHANGGLAVGTKGGTVTFGMNSNAADATIWAEGSAFAGMAGGKVIFNGSASAGNASIMVSSGGYFSGYLYFADQSSGGTARVFLNGGLMDISGQTGGGIALSSVSGTGNIYLGGNQLTVGGSNLSMDLAATISEGSQATGGSLRKIGSGTLILSGYNNYHTGDTFLDGGTLRLYCSQINSTINMASGTLLESETNILNTLTIGGLSGLGTVQINGTTIAMGNNNSSTTYSGVLQGPGGLTKIGTGTLTLTGANTYIGSTIVNDGQLVIDGSVVSATTVNGGRLGGSGSMLGVTINSTGTLAPGSSAGILHVTGNLSLTMGATYLVDLNGTAVGTQYDQTDVIGSVSLGDATLSVSVGFSIALGDQFTIIKNDGTDAVTGTFSGLAEGSTFAAGGEAFLISYQGGDGNDVVLTSVVPEPTALVLFTAGAALLYGIFGYARPGSSSGGS